MRDALVPQRWIAGMHVVAALPMLVGSSGLPVAGVVVALVQPITAVLLFSAGARLAHGTSPRPGRALQVTAVIYGLALVAAFVWGLARAEPQEWLSPMVEASLSSILVAAVMGPLVAVVTFGCFGFSLRALGQGPTALGQAVLPVAAIVVTPPLGWLAYQTGRPGFQDLGFYLWVALPQVAVAASVWLIHRRAKETPAELDLRAAVDAVPDTELLLDRLPIGVRARIACAIPHGLRRADGDATLLHNPVLDHALALHTDNPAATEALLQDQESTVLQVLHAWPQAQLESDAVVWQADVDQLGAAARAQGQTIHAELETQVGNARALAALFQPATLTAGGPHDPAADGVHDERP